MKSALYERYQKEIRPNLQKALDIDNPMEVPRIEKVVINAGIGSYLQKIGSKDPSEVIHNIEAITGQKSITRYAKLSVSNFKLREGMPVGVSVTMRKQAAYNFLDKLINVVFPRVSDFRGVKNGIFDHEGNVSFGFDDHTVFPEVTIPEDSRKVHGLQVTIVISGKDQDKSKALMDAFGFPFKK